MTDPTMPKDPSDNVLEAMDRYTTSLGIYCAARYALIAEQSKPQQIAYEPFDLERALSGESVFNRDGEERKITRHAFSDQVFIVHYRGGAYTYYNERELSDLLFMRCKTTTKYYAFVLWHDGQYTSSGTYDSIEELHQLVTQHKGTIIAEHSIEVPA